MMINKQLNIPEHNFLVVGAPRSGFTLLITILNKLREDGLWQPKWSDHQRAINKLIPDIGTYLDKRIESFWYSRIPPEDYIYNGEFRVLVGGPKWESDNTAHICKYFGFKDKGDFLLIIKLPIESLDWYPVVHTHDPETAQFSGYADYKQMASIRDPRGILMSSVLSINAVTSEYIQRYGERNPQEIREELAKWKLSSKPFFNGLVDWLVKYWNSLHPLIQQFTHIMRWEDLLKKPVKNICKIADCAGFNISESHAADLWKKIDHRNIPKYHHHNYRDGGGIPGSWKKYLLNEHLEIIEDKLSGWLHWLGENPGERIPTSAFSNFQKELISYPRDLGAQPPANLDKNIFLFAYNKTNTSNSEIGELRFHDFDDTPTHHIYRSSYTDRKTMMEFNEVLTEEISFISTALLHPESLSDSEHRRLYVTKN